jgi:hypothetical protein
VRWPASACVCWLLGPIPTTYPDHSGQALLPVPAPLVSDLASNYSFIGSANSHGSASPLQCLQSHSGSPRGEPTKTENEGANGGRYIYEPLATNNHIRLIWLLESSDPSQNEDQLRCEIRHFPLDDAPRYVGISYVWGAPNFTETLYCGNGTLKITKNLDSALRVLRLLTESVEAAGLPRGGRYVWADAVCINQGDNLEKAHQIRLMRRIFETASPVLVWLGDDISEEISTARRILLSLRMIADDYGLVSTNPVQFIHRPIDIHASPKWSHHYSLDQLFRTFSFDWAALDKLLRNDWFSRRWVVQEFAVSRKTVFICGHRTRDSLHCFDWNEFCRAVAVLRYEANRGILDSVSWGNAWALVVVSESFLVSDERKHPSLDILDLLDQFRDFNCSNDLDRVFALAGISKESNSISIDYSKSPLDVYKDLARQCILDSRWRILHLVTRYFHDEVSDSSSEWPSWVPDWRNVGEPCFGGLASEKTRTATGMESVLRLDPDGRSLYIKGIRHDDRVKTCLSYEVGTTNLGEFITRARALFNNENRGGFTESAHFPIRDGIVVPGHTVGMGAMIKTVLPHSSAQNFKLGEHHLAAALVLGCISPISPLRSLAQPWLSKWDIWDIWEPYMCYKRYIYENHADQLRKVKDAESFQFEKRLADVYALAVHDAAQGRCLFVTEKGFMGMGPARMQAGDVVTIFCGAETPFILRPLGDKFRIVGECYIPGLMNGEALEDNLDEYEFVII